jgi:hypothetical protein
VVLLLTSLQDDDVAASPDYGFVNVDTMTLLFALSPAQHWNCLEFARDLVDCQQDRARDSIQRFYSFRSLYY